MWIIVPCSATVWSDSQLLAQIGRNLISNAVRYTRSGGILLGVRRRAALAWLQVWDTGIGIAPDKIDFIFDELYQIRNPERDREKGMGLGLPIVKRIAALLDLQLDVRSVPGRGSVFSVAVPLSPGTFPAIAPAGPELAGERSLTVLIIDDDAMVRDALRLMLSDWGHHVIDAGSAEEAIERLKGQPRLPDVVLADYRLRNNVTGRQVIESLRQRFHSPLPGIIITGDTDPDRQREAAASDLGILFKPVDPESLRRELLDAADVTARSG